MGNAADEVFPDVDIVFDSALYNAEELEFMVENLGESPGVARSSPGFPTAPDSVPPVQLALQRFKDLEELSQREQVDGWVGMEAVKAHIENWQERQRRYFKLKEQDPEGKGFHPEMYKFDSRGKAHWAGPGTCSGRVMHPLNLLPVTERSRQDFTKGIGDEPEVEVEVEATYNRDACVFANEGEDDPTSSYLDCPVCHDHFKYDANSQHSQNGAWGQLSKHLNGDQNKLTVDDHRLAKQELFPS